MTTNKLPPEQPYPVREVSRDAYNAILANEWPSSARSWISASTRPATSGRCSTNFALAA